MKTVPARIAPRTAELIKALAEASDRKPREKTTAALCAVGLDLYHRIMVELGQLAPEVGEGIPSHPWADETLDALREAWATATATSTVPAGYSEARAMLREALAREKRVAELADEAIARAAEAMAERDRLRDIAERGQALADRLMSENDALLAEVERLNDIDR